MRKTTIFVFIVLLIALATPVFALGPVDVEAGASYWLSDTKVAAGETTTVSSDDISLWAQIWVKKWGAKAAVYKTDLSDDIVEGPQQIDYTSLDFRYKVVRFSENNFLALGMGYQSIDVDTNEGSIDSSGWRLSAETHVGLARIVNFYGEGAYYFGMDDLKGGGKTSGENLNGWELEVGVSIKPFPFFNIRAGYRQSNVDFDMTPEEAKAAGPGSSIKPDGFIVGISINF